MYYLYLISDIKTNGFLIEILDILSLICILFGIYTIISKNHVVSVLFLIGLFYTISCYLILICLSFIGISYLLVYVSANNLDAVLMDVTNITSIGNIMYSAYSIWLLMVSIILLLAMIGSIVITINPDNKLS